MKLTMKNTTVLIALAFFMLGACKKDVKEIGMVASKLEGVKASWELSKAVQVDEQSLTKESANITGFFTKAGKLPNISFSDTTYTVDTAGLSFNFFGGAAGTWKFDDQEYPSKITFMPTGGASFDLKLNGPIRPQDNLRLSKEITHSCKGKATWVMSYNLEFTRK